ncbi:hypothetical protein PRUPE_5G198400 [Prunus persica]|nr:protein yippee-like At4g27740 [Prunus persica]XP_020419674.1 protein yippee-like At4g27740 [Prunus persica]XP_020419675.1 protein yippee-like At4g27740 [Prunus persica]XP_034215456.1 protein yippee-like At4g27740 [Prunus dulcis]XP_034215457.1 protein yippee-like At4g27740 [Prunus dulcis]XP_034215458.1 protein yippee-like At4g27740 [Prunus dulcis]XP_034215459.1 protein yippee-like At4g27740 [Prunus dulcis]XP_034215460.1 protein yippee-like At4g27740 [Prunus dulcis]ONI08741.1 hypothetical 
MAQFGGNPFFSCRNCQNPLALRDDLVSKKFVTKSGAGYMFSHAMNIIVGQKEDRKLMTGVFSIADIFCSNCGEVLGWKYVRAYEISERYKEGKFIIERAKIAKEY